VQISNHFDTNPSVVILQDTKLRVVFAKKLLWFILQRCQAVKHLW